MNDDARFDRLQDLIAESIARDPSERAAFLLAACGEDAELRAEAESLLGYEQAGDDLLENSALVRFADSGEPHEPGVGELRPGDVLGDCRIINLLGEGGAGEVYLAEDMKLERRVALKLLKRRLGDDTLGRRFQHERKVLAALTHPNIARLYGGTVTPEGRSYFVMEYVEGERLDVYCHTRRLTLAERLQLFRKVCAGVAYAHQNLVVHRDLKPANIRVTPEGEPKLLDFGIAKLLDPEDSQGADPTVTMFGAMTPEYASPEQIRGEAITTASDVYSLGVVLYELLTGQRPYRLKGRRHDELARAICEEEAPRPSTVASTLPADGDGTTEVVELPVKLRRLLKGDLDNIVGKALRKEPARRYASVAQLADDLRRHAEGLPVSARRDTVSYRTGKFVRRNKVVVAAAALVTLALVTGLVAATWQAHLARQERDRAQFAQTKAETALKQAERINGFLQNLFSSADTTKLGKDVTVLQVLDAASARLDRDLANEPEVLAQARLTMAKTYASLFVQVPATENAQAAYDLFRRLHGDDHPDTIAATSLLATVLRNRGLFEQCEPLFLRRLASVERQPVPDLGRKGRILTSLAHVQAFTGKISQAKASMAEARRLILQTSGERSDDYANWLTINGTVIGQAGDDLAALEMYRQSLTLSDEIQPGSLKTLSRLQNLCGGLFAVRRFDELEEAVRRLEREAKQVGGEQSVIYAAALGWSGLNDFVRGNYQQTVVTERRAMALTGSTFADDSLPTVSAKTHIGLSLARIGRADEGEPLVRQAFNDGQKFAKLTFNNTFGNLDSALGECLLAQGRHAEAEPLLLAGHDELKARLGEKHVQSVRVKRLLHDLYTAWNKPAQADRFASVEAAQPAPTP